MNLRKVIFTENDCYRKGVKIKPKGVMVHSTGSNNPKLKRYVQPDDGSLGVNTNGNDWNRSGIAKCVHAMIGKLADGTVATYQTLPWDYRGWHCGRSGNDTHISFEILEDDLSDKTYFDKVYREAVELTAYLCREFNLNPMATGVVVCHSEGHDLGIASNHGDVMHWFPKHGKSMDTFRADVWATMYDESEKPKNYYRIRKSWEDSKSQTGAYKRLDYAKKACPKGYSVYDWNGNPVYTNQGEVKIDYAKSYDKLKACGYRVKANGGLNLRTGAGTDKAIVEVMPNGSKVKCYGYHTNHWLLVVSEAGNEGFCHSDYLVVSN